MSAPAAVVVGGGVAGLAAARSLVRAGFAVTVLEAAPRWGGKLASVLPGGVRLDSGAESVLARRPEALALIHDLGLDDRLVHPTPAAAQVLVGGEVRSLPPSAMGVPRDLDALAGYLSPAGLHRARQEPDLPAPPFDGDLGIGAYVDSRFGPEVTDRLLEPLLGGVYAGQSRLLSFEAVSPALFARVRSGGSLLGHAQQSTVTSAHGPVFAGLVGGVATLVDALVADLVHQGATLRSGVTVRQLSTGSHGGYRLLCGHANDPDLIECDAIVLAAPARPSGRLLSGLADGATTGGRAALAAVAGDLAAIPYASTAVLTLVLRGAQLTGSGLLVPPGELATIKALTYSSSKWAWVADGAHRAWGPDASVVRVSVGRLGEERLLQLDDDALLARTWTEARGLPGWERAELVTAEVARWGGALPQYLVGHRALVERVRAAEREWPGLALCGAALDGVGVAACLASATAAAGKVAHDLSGGSPAETSPDRPIIFTTAGREESSMKARDINATIRYTMWSVFRRTARLDDTPAQNATAAFRSIEGATAERDVVIRGWYDVAGLRADADLMVWWHAPTSEALQDAYLALRRSSLGYRLEPVWSQLALHRPAEFNKGHVPAFMQDEDPKAHLCVYPFVRSYEWYLLPEQERRAMLAEHGMLARPYPDVRANTVSSFALGDYEWMLAFEADELHRIVDLMRDLRAAAARRHTREEVPFYTGRRRELEEILASW